MISSQNTTKSNEQLKEDQSFMTQAIFLAQESANKGEVPVGALVVYEGTVVGQGANNKENKQCATNHAEIIAIEQASTKINSWRLSECTLYVTLEPCLMCAGALQQARIKRLVFGAFDPKGGACGSLYSIHDDRRLNHCFPVIGGVMEVECSQILKKFFSNLRNKKKLKKKPETQQLK